MELSLLQGLMLMLVGFICSIDKQTEALYWFRPIVASFFTGLVLGDVQLGLECGAVAELAYLGMTNVGGTVPPDPLMAGIMTVVIAYTTGNSPEAALGLSYPFALLAQGAGILMNTAYSIVPQKCDEYIEQGNIKAFKNIIVYGTILKSVIMAILIFLCTYALQGPVQVFVQTFPQWIIHGFEVAGGILPAVGLAMLLLTTLTPKTTPYLLIGFLMATFIEMPNVLPVAILGGALAYISYLNDKKTEETVSSMSFDGGDIDGI